MRNDHFGSLTALELAAFDNSSPVDSGMSGKSKRLSGTGPPFVATRLALRC
jgi:hypothetical protein